MSTHAERVSAWLASRADEMVALLDRLVAEPTENPPGVGLGACARLLAAELERLGLEPELIAIPGPHTLDDPYLVRAQAGDGEKLLYFHGHYDVVPVQDREQFTMRREGRRLIGRGTADMPHKASPSTKVFAAAGAFKGAKRYSSGIRAARIAATTRAGRARATSEKIRTSRN